MQPRTKFFLRVAVISLVFFVGWWTALASGLGWAVLEDGGFALVALAVIIASVVPSREKVRALLLLIGVFTLVETVAVLTGLHSMAEDPGLVDGVGRHVALTVFHAFRLGFPLAVVVLFAGRDHTRLWRRAEPHAGLRKCPECGRRFAGLEDHVRDAHGHKAARRLQAG